MAHIDAVLIITTLGSEPDSEKFIRALLEKRLIACGTITPNVRSIYRWDNKVADERESLVILKTRSACLDSIQLAFEELHPYKLPELLVIPVAAGLPKYLEWIAGETGLGLTN